MIGLWKTYLNEFRPALRRANEFYLSQGFDLFVRTGLSASIVMAYLTQHENIRKNKEFEARQNNSP